MQEQDSTDTQSILRQQVVHALTDLQRDTEPILKDRRQRLDALTKNIVDLYSTHVRNMAIISGTVAPFSLTLLGVKELQVHAGLLVLGFILLLSNVVLAQYLQSWQLRMRSTTSLKAELEWLTASTNHLFIDDTEEHKLANVMQITDVVQSLDKLDRFLGVEYGDLTLQQTRANLHTYSRVVDLLFAIGCSCIIASILVAPLSHTAVELWSSVQTLLK